MAVPQSLYVLAGAITALASALWLIAIAPLGGLIAASWAALTIVHAFAVAVTAVLAMLVTAAGALLAADWRADFQSHQAWAEVYPTPELAAPLDHLSQSVIDPRYLVAVDNQALWRILQAHRFALPMSGLQATKMVPAASRTKQIIVASAEPVPAPGTSDPTAKIACDLGSNTRALSEVGISVRSVRKHASIIAVETSNAPASCRGSLLALRAERAMARTRLVANANAWSGWPVRDEIMLTATRPGRHAADVIVLGSNRDDEAQPFHDGYAHSNIASSTEPPSCRGPPQVVKSARQASAAGALPAADPVVRDNLGREVPVCATELDVIETYLDRVLRDLLASSTGGPEQEQA